MSGAAFIVIINLLVTGLFCGSFALIAAHSGYRSARWFAAAYAMGMVYLALEAVLPTLTDARIAVVLGAIAFTATLLLLNVGLACRYGMAPPVRLLSLVLGFSILSSGLIVDMPRDSILRMAVYQAPYAAMQMIGAWIVMRAPVRGRLDTILGIFIILGAVHFLAKPFLATLFGGPGASAQAYIETNYAMVSQSLGVVLSVATALLLLAALILDAYRDITRRSETDGLSGLLIRRAFEERLHGQIEARTRNGLPLSVIMCDLDHFKAINDTHGHAAGDRLIARFATVVREACQPHYIAARIGGEEFAILLPGSNLAAARLFAEHVRSTYTTVAGGEHPDWATISASFGVAEFLRGEEPSQFLSRADDALYAAKRDGRNRVRISLALEDAAASAANDHVQPEIVTRR